MSLKSETILNNGCLTKKMSNLSKLKKENKLLKETCVILGDKILLKEINLSLKQISNGKGIKLSDL